jgi:excisionase family DNA binding protein
LILTVKELMEEYKVSRTTIYRWMEKGMPVMRVKGVVRFDKQQVMEWFKEQSKSNANA